MNAVVDATERVAKSQRSTSGAALGRGPDWDVICIGSGMGSLAAAATLARTGRSVLVLESHSQLGGLTHSFARRGRRWATGFHYTGWPTAYENDFPDLWRVLTRNEAAWEQLPEDNDVYLHPQGSFTKRATRSRYRDDLCEAFPQETGVIDRYLADMKSMLAEYRRFMKLQSIPPLLERLGVGWIQGRRFLRWDRQLVQQYMDSIGASKRLRETLWFNWGNFDGHPQRTSIGAYCVPMEYMMDGLWTPRDGACSAASAFAKALQNDGGSVRTKARVDALLTRNGRVHGVQVNGESLKCRTVISGIGARETYGLIDESERPVQARRILQLPSTASIITVYLSLDCRALQNLGLTAVNYWVESEVDSMYGYWEDFAKPPPWFVLSLASAYQHPNGATRTQSAPVPAELFVGTKHTSFANWAGTQTKRRGADYQELKSRILEHALSQAELTWPGFREAIEYAEASTPLTIESYTGHKHGAAYGIAPIPGRYSERGLRCHSGIGNLILAGQDVSAAGVIGAFYGGLAAASTVLRRDATHLLLEPRRFSRLDWFTRGVIS